MPVIVESCFSIILHILQLYETLNEIKSVVDHYLGFMLQHQRINYKFRKFLLHTVTMRLNNDKYTVMN